MTLDEQLEILQAAKRGEKIEWSYNSPYPYWEPLGEVNNFQFNFSSLVFRIADPYAVPKAVAKDPTKQIRLLGGPWHDSGYDLKWSSSPQSYEIRDKPKPKKVVKYLCRELNGWLSWTKEDVILSSGDWKRRPAFDKECEVEDAK